MTKTPGEILIVMSFTWYDRAGTSYHQPQPHHTAAAHTRIFVYKKRKKKKE